MKKSNVRITVSFVVVLGLFLIIFLLKILSSQKAIDDIQDTLSDYNDIDYVQLENGTWQCDGVEYKYYLELDGKWPGVDKNGSAVVLSNTKEIDFDDITDYLFSSQSMWNNSSDWILIHLETEE